MIGDLLYYDSECFLETENCILQLNDTPYCFYLKLREVKQVNHPSHQKIENDCQFKHRLKVLQQVS